MAKKRIYQAADAQPVVLYVKHDPDSEDVYPIVDTTFGGDVQILIDDVTTTSMTYIGYASIGAATSEAVWKIKRIDESGTPNTTVVKFATAGASSCIYDNRASLTYT